MERVYFPINEKDAAHARGMWSFTSYEQGSTTREYRAAVDEAYDLADEAATRN